MKQVLALIALVTFAAGAQTPVVAQDEGIAVGSAAPIITVPDLDGKPVKVGHVVGSRAAVIEFWATWCELCHALMPNMRAAHAAYGSRVDFYGVNVTVNDKKERVKRYVAEEKPPFVTVYDEKGESQRAFGAMATSYVVIVDKTGRVRYTGSGGKQDIAAELKKVLGP